MSILVPSKTDETGVQPPRSWFGADLRTWNSRIQSALANAKESALLENEELCITSPHGQTGSPLALSSERMETEIDSVLELQTKRLQLRKKAAERLLKLKARIGARRNRPRLRVVFPKPTGNAAKSMISKLPDQTSSPAFAKEPTAS